MSSFHSDPYRYPSPPNRQRRFQNSRAYILAVTGFMGIFLFGYDTGLGGAVLNLKSFQKEFGLRDEHGRPVPNITSLQGNIVSVLQGGAFFGALFGAPMQNYLGRKRALIVGCLIFIAGAVVQTACFGSIDQFLVGRLVSGIGVGVMSTVCPTYASEIAPKEVRGRVTGIFQISVVTGVACSFWINYGVTYMHESSRQWRVPIGFQLVPVGLMMMFLPRIRESPRWLAVKHRDEQALDNLAWIRKAHVEDQDINLEFAEIQAAIREEEDNTRGATWRDVFAKGNPVRFIIAFWIFTLQQWSGQNSFSYYAPFVFGSVGISGKHITLLTSGIFGLVKIVATTIFIMFGVERYGRKKPLLIGLVMMSGFLWIIGAVARTTPVQQGPDLEITDPSPASIGMAVMLYLFVIPYCFSVGPLPWVICSEIFSNRTRSYGLMTAAASQWLGNFAVTMATPHIIKAMPRGSMFFFFAAINMVSLVLTMLFIPETQGVSLEGMDIIFGSTTPEQRQADIALRTRALHFEGHEKHAEALEQNIRRSRENLASA